MMVLGITLGCLAVLIALGNLAILAAHLRARRRVGTGDALPVGIEKAYMVTDRLWRSARPGPAGYAALAALGLTTAVDLRAEGGSGPAVGTGVRHVIVPIRDGRPPTPDQVETILDAVRSDHGAVLVHCSAGVGRTGASVAAYRVLVSGVEPRVALGEMLAMGPPSWEQIAFVRRLAGGARRSPRAVVAVSRFLDSPRRAWSLIRGAVRRLIPTQHGGRGAVGPSRRER